MKLEQGNLILKRPYKEVYKCDNSIVKVFETFHPKSAVFNEALNTVRVRDWLRYTKVKRSDPDRQEVVAGHRIQGWQDAGRDDESRP